MEKLYEALNKSGKYTKSLEDFKNQFSSTVGQEKLYGALKSSGDYTKSFSDFSTQFFNTGESVKTNDSAAADPSVESNATGSNWETGSSEPRDASDFNNTQEKDTAFERQFGKNEFTDFFGDIYRAWDAGTEAGGSVNEAFDIYKGKEATDEEVYDFLKKSRKIEEKGQTDEMIALSEKQAQLKKEGYNGVSAFFLGWWDNPTAMMQYSVQSLSQMGRALFDSEEVAGAAAATAGAGALAGGGTGAALTAWAGPGALFGAGAGAIGGTVGGFFGGLSGAMETGMTTAALIQEEAIKEGLDWGNLSDKERFDYIRSLQDNTERFNDLKSKAVARGVTIGAIDGIVGAVSGGTGGAAFKSVAAGSRSALANAARVGAVATLETAGGMLSEVAGQAAAGQEFNLEEILIEGFADKTFTGASIIQSAVQGGPKYSINGEKMNGKRFIDNIKILDDEAFVTQTEGIKVENSPAVEKLISDRRQNIAADQDVDSRISDVTDRTTAINLVKEQNKLKNNKTGNKTRLTQIQAELDVIADKYADSQVDATIEQRKEAVANAVDNAFEASFNKNYKAVSEAGKKIGLKTTVYKTERGYKDAILKAFGELPEGWDSSQGVFAGNGKLFINKTAAKQAVNIATGDLGGISVASHEALHPMLNALVGDATTQGQFVSDFKKQMTSKQKKYVSDQLKARDYAPDAEAIELMNIFSDGIIKNEINYDQTTFEKLGDTIVNFFRSKLGLTTNEISFDDGRSVFNFLKEYNNSLKEGKVSDKAIQAIKDAETKKNVKVKDAKILSQGQFSKTIAEAELALQEAQDADPNDPMYFDNLDKAEAALDAAEDAAKNPQVPAPEVKKETKPKPKVNKPEKPTRTTDLSPRDPISKKIMDTYNEGMEGVERTEYKASKPLPASLEGKLIPLFEGYINTIVQQKFKQFAPEALEFQDALAILRAEVIAAIRTYNPAKNKDLAGYVKKIVQTRQSLMFKEANTEFTSDLDEAKGVVATKDTQSIDRSGNVERGQRTFDELDIVDEDLINDIRTELEKEIRVRVQKGTLSETIEVKKGRDTYIVSWLENYVNKQLFKKLLKKVGAITGVYPNAVIPGTYIDFLNDPNTFDIVTKALPIKSIKKSYGKLFPIEKVGRELTAEGNPVFRIKPIDKKTFLTYFVKGKKSAVLERQKQLFREILEPLAKQIVADYATPENLSELKSIQELAPAQSSDVVNSISIEAKLNDLESQIDRYKDEKTGFDIIQFSKSLSKEDRAAVSEKLGYKSDGVIAMAQLAAQIISQTISPTRTKYNKSLKTIEEKLGPELWEKVWKNTLKDYTDILDSFKAKQEYTNGVLAEQVVWDVFSKTPGIKVVSKRPSNKSGDTGADIIIKHKQKEYIFEIKYNKTSRITSTNVKNYSDVSKMETTRDIGEESNKIVMDAIKNSKPLQDFVSKVDKFMAENYPGENYITDSGYIELTPKQYEELNLGDSLYKKSVTYINGLNEKMIETIYNGKDTNYIGFLDIGTFHVGENIAGLPIPKFEGDLFTRAWLKKGAPKANGKMTFILKMYSQLTTESSDALAAKSTMSIISSESINSNFKRTQFSKSEKDFDTFGMADIVSRQMFPNAFVNKSSYAQGYDSLSPKQQAAVKAEMKKYNLFQFSKTLNQAKAMSNRIDAPNKGISVWDFDDTLATTKSNVLYTLPNGTKGKINATEFALQADNLEKQGAEFDFSEFSKVMNGAKGPMFDKAVARNKKFGNSNVYILTARPANSKYAIHTFLKGIGLDIKLENIFGLGDGTALAKAKWVIGKVAEGYNDFYFADDAYKNVKAVQEVLEQADVKSKVHQAKIQFAKSLNSDFNNIIQDVTGIDADKKISGNKAKMLGKKKGRFKFFLPPSAEDFAGLLYKLTGKGKKGEAHQAWFKKSLFDPFAKGIREFESYKQNATAIVKQLKKSIKNIPAGLGKINETGFTNEAAVRVYLWTKNGFDIPDLTAEEQQELVDVVNNNPKLKKFADQLDKVLDGYPEPQDSWVAGTITTDAINMINTVKRAEFLKEWQENADAIFTKDNINKLRSQFGDSYVEALQDMLYRMKTGRNRPSGANKLTNRFMNWVNDSVGTIMFFNTRSALLQTLSIVNFINWHDNNPIQAAKAFANQKQFWSDFAMIFNSDFLKQRRSGLKNDVNADDIASAAENETNKAKAVFASLLKAGFLPTQIADSFAIAMGGASFIRNRINMYVAEGMTKAKAEEQAFLDFQEIAEETQQSSRPDRISQQQASPLGRIVLAFANTPMQYMRLSKKAFLDLINRRGDAKTNITKIIYYTAVQNIIFSSLQAALFAVAFDDDEEKAKDKEIRVANSMLDSILRGTGIYGAIASTLKNIVAEIYTQSEKSRPDYTVAAQRALSISPPIDSKMRKIMSAARAFSYKTTREKMVGYGLDNPAYYAVGQILSAGFNLPVDRLIRKADNIRVALDNETKMWQSIALTLGYSQWDLGLIESGKNKKSNKKGWHDVKRGSWKD